MSTKKQSNVGSSQHERDTLFWRLLKNARRRLRMQKVLLMGLEDRLKEITPDSFREEAEGLSNILCALSAEVKTVERTITSLRGWIGESHTGNGPKDD